MLRLFILETCPYCKKVMDFLDNQHMKYENALDTTKPFLSSATKIGF